MKQKRFLLIFVAVLVVTGAGYVSWKTWGTKAPSSPQNNQTADPSEGGKYLVIKEWGVHVPYDILGSKDTFYKLISSDRLYFYKTGLQERFLQLSSEEQSAFNQCADYPQNVIIRTQLKNTADSDDQANYLKNPLKQIADYGYYVAPPQALCPGVESYPRITELLNDYLAVYSSKRVSAIKAFESIN